jgi:hypothetical protein
MCAWAPSEVFFTHHKRTVHYLLGFEQWYTDASKSFSRDFAFSQFYCIIYRYLRAVAYRWIIRYIFGYLGWDNTRPLPACVYHDIRKRFSTGWSKGYASALERQ